MFKRLINLKSALLSFGLKAEATEIDKLIKLAVPIEGIVSPGETSRRYSETEEDEDEWEEPEFEDEEPTIEPDSISGYPKDTWYGSLSALGNSVILIPMSLSSLEDDDIWALSIIFGLGYESDSASLLEKINAFSYEAQNKLGDRHALKEHYPNLWSAISKILADKRLREEEVIYLIFDEDESPNPNVFLDPKFFAHDIGHIDADFGLQGEGYERADLPYSIWNFSFEASRLYKDEDGYSLATALSDEEDEEYYNSDDIKEMTHHFFPQNVFSGDPEDEVNDVISAALAGELMAEIPAKITFKGEEYYLEESRKDDLLKLISNFEEEFMQMIQTKGSSEDKWAYKGPLGEARGHVIVYSVN